MKIEALKLKPQLIEVVLDDKDLVQEYGEPITFWMYNHLDIKTYFDFFSAQSERDTDKLLNIIRSIIRDQDGREVLGPDDQLPIDIFTETIIGISRYLGKSKTKNSDQTEIGTQP